MFGSDDNGALVMVACDLCGRVLHDEEEMLPEKGTDGRAAWCSHWHSPDGLVELREAIDAFDEWERQYLEDRWKAGLENLQAIIDRAVAEALAARGIR